MPTPRPDKNGKVVIRHMKVEVGDNTINVPIPPPMTPSCRDESMDAVRYDLTDAIVEATIDYSEMGVDDWDNTVPQDAIYSKLLPLSSFILIDLDDIRVNDPARFHLLARMVEQGESEAFLSNYIAYADLEDPDSDGMDIALVRSLGCYQRFEQYGFNLRTAEPDVQASARALLEVTRDVLELAEDDEFDTDDFKLIDHDYDFQRTPVIGNKELVDYIMENPELSSEIAAAINTRKTLSLEAIRVVMEHPQRPLANGAL